MNSVSILPQKPLEMASGPAALVLRRLQVLEQAEGFCDRVMLASEFLIDLHTMAVIDAISADQQIALFRRLRAVLQSDLGAVTSDDATSPIAGAPL